MIKIKKFFSNFIPLLPITILLLRHLMDETPTLHWKEQKKPKQKWTACIILHLSKFNQLTMKFEKMQFKLISKLENSVSLSCQRKLWIPQTQDWEEMLEIVDLGS